MTDQPRCVWLDDLDVRRIESLTTFFYADDPVVPWMQSLVDRMRAAPADPVEAVRRECWTSLDGYVSPNHSQMVAEAVLRALGYPGDAS